MKYIPSLQVKRESNHRGGRRPGVQLPHIWKTGPDIKRREKYYAWLKHKAQASYRNEDYSLTFEEWERLWTDDLFKQRGRKIDDLCLMKINIDEGWHYNNVIVVARRVHLPRAREYRDRS